MHKASHLSSETETCLCKNQLIVWHMSDIEYSVIMNDVIKSFDWEFKSMLHFYAPSIEDIGACCV